MYKSFSVYDTQFKKKNTKVIAKSIYSMALGLTDKAVYRGSHEAAIFEAQGGKLLGSLRPPEDHLQSLQGGQRGIDNATKDLIHALASLRTFDDGLYTRLSKSFARLVEAGRRNGAICRQTSLLATQLALEEPHRLEGYPVRHERDRTGSALVSSQMMREHRSSEGALMGDLIPRLEERGLGSYLAELMSLPTDHPGAVVALSPILQALAHQPNEVANVRDADAKASLERILRPVAYAVEAVRMSAPGRDMPSNIDALVDDIYSEKRTVRTAGPVPWA